MTFQKRLTKLQNEVLASIVAKMKRKSSFEFEDTVNLSYADEEMRLLKKDGLKVKVVTLDNKSGIEGFEYDLTDLPIDDLIWIETQLP
jgi:hypothetical protein